LESTPRFTRDFLTRCFWLAGVYQEVMGSPHNMLGQPHAVHVRLANDNAPGALPLRLLVSGGGDMSKALRDMPKGTAALQKEGQLSYANHNKEIPGRSMSQAQWPLPVSNGDGAICTAKTTDS
jgi:hypothetical protein